MIKDKRKIKSERWFKHRHDSRLAVIERAAGMCEAPECGDHGTAWCHAFGRGHIISEPLASCSTMTFWLCRSHHDRLDQREGHDLAFQESMRAFAVAMTIHGLGLPAKELMPLGMEEPVGVARAIERMLRARGEM